MSSRLIAIIRFPPTIKGLNFPNLVLHLSIITPMMGSVIPSNTRMAVSILAAATTVNPTTPVAKYDRKLMPK